MARVLTHPVRKWCPGVPLRYAGSRSLTIHFLL